MSAPDTTASGERGPWGDPERHLSREELETRLAALSPPKDAGSLALIVARRDDETRDTPERVLLTREGGVPGDAWARTMPGRHETQLAVMRVDVARLMANGQPLTLFGDNLLVDLDLSFENLPAGTTLRLGSALLRVTPEPHDGCHKFRQRFGRHALRLTADPRFKPQRLRGIYLEVVEDGEVSVGDRIEVVERAR